MRASVPPIPATGIGFDRLSTLQVATDLQVDTVVAIGLNSGELLTLVRHLNEWKPTLQRFAVITGSKEIQEITTSCYR
jgi:molybdenum cofactor biosynthesis enzyme MoaA